MSKIRSDASSGQVPRRITLVICPVCGRKAFSFVDLKQGHFERGKRCDGKPEAIMYVDGELKGVYAELERLRRIETATSEYLVALDAVRESPLAPGTQEAAYEQEAALRTALGEPC